MIISIYVPAIPIAQPRARATQGRGGHARIHEVTHIKNAVTGERKPHPIAAFKATVKHAARDVFMGPPLDGPLCVDVLAVFPRPKLPKKFGAGRLPHTKKPDRDNIDKAILDSLKGIVFADDKQVCDGRIQKVIAAGDEQPHVEVIITTIGD